MVHDVWVMLNLYPYWVVLWVDVCNTFNLVSRSTIFPRVMTFAWFFGLVLPICLTIICTFISTVFFPSFLTWGFHNHFIEIRYTIGRSVVYSNSFLRFLPYSNIPPYLCFPFLSGWYTYNRSHIRCGFCIFIIIRKIISIWYFSATSECVIWSL